MTSVMDYEENEERRVQARFVTKLKSPFKVPKTTLAIPANVTRFGLSDIVNSLLRSQDPEWKGEPFDFLIEGKLIRSKLDEFLAAKKISTEKVLEIEYIKAVTPREEEEPSLHDDWVSAVDGSCSRFIFTGCYDGLGRLWKAAGECTHILEGHTDAITSVSVVNTEGEGIVTLATASKDQTLRLWKVDGDVYGDSPTKISAFKVLRGHSASVQSVAAQASGRMVCSGSFDSTISLWETSQSDAETDSVSIKKRKVKKDVEEHQLEGEAVSTLTGHSQRVSSVVWPVNDRIYSASWDHSIRMWDVETCKDLLNIFCGKALNCLHVGGEGSALVAAGGSDHILRIWDPRMPGTSAPIFKLSSHKSWISACKWHNKSLFHLVSSSYDEKLLLWDLRAADSFLNDMDSHEGKVLCADWWRGDSIVSGGADSKLCIFSDVSVY